ncbi:GntR family transcriptional regulator [Weissella diestrammenae]|uniref:GntR family transcriptional regulator n=1 Tax=Weissella diestrammenae TaxID=1162633 RepID=A0A7G9T3W1_9LACO|nr:GntR family transcriptional regulator [Weissella diestrammenae]MCM0582111.1 GntR family transcriptional regulator [Weissella diestrammenae]QNN74786.1 GntR family transcriptional regulator [Weissella diestrammenae]
MVAPIYIQIHDEIKEAIDAGRWVAGERIPSERELSEQFDVSRMTLRQAVMLLVDEGYLERRVGSGTYVATARVQENLDRTSSFTEMMAAAGKIASSQVISYKIGQPTPQEVDELQIDVTTSVLRMERVRSGDGEPIAFEVAVVPAHLVKGLPEETVTASLYHALTDQGLIVGQAKRILTAGLVQETVAPLLAMKVGEPVLVLTQLTLDSLAHPFEFVRTQYVASRFEFQL